MHMKKALWEMSIEELDEEIASVEAMLQATGYVKLWQDHLNVLQEQREERQIEANILKGSRFAKEVLQTPQGMVEARNNDGLESSLDQG